MQCGYFDARKVPRHIVRLEFKNDLMVLGLSYNLQDVDR